MSGVNCKYREKPKKPRSICGSFNSPAGKRGELKVIRVNLHLYFFLPSSNNYPPYE